MLNLIHVYLAKFRYLVVKGCLTFFGTVKLLFIYHGNRVRCAGIGASLSTRTFHKRKEMEGK